MNQEDVIPTQAENMNVPPNLGQQLIIITNAGGSNNVKFNTAPGATGVTAPGTTGVNTDVNGGMLSVYAGEEVIVDYLVEMRIPNSEETKEGCYVLNEMGERGTIFIYLLTANRLTISNLCPDV